MEMFFWVYEKCCYYNEQSEMLPDSWDSVEIDEVVDIVICLKEGESENEKGKINFQC